MVSAIFIDFQLFYFISRIFPVILSDTLLLMEQNFVVLIFYQATSVPWDLKVNLQFAFIQKILVIIHRYSNLLFLAHLVKRSCGTFVIRWYTLSVLSCPYLYLLWNHSVKLNKPLLMHLLNTFFIKEHKL